jgi:hypothetical protein
VENSIQYGKKHYASAVTQGLEVKIYLVNTEELKKDHNSFTEGGHHIAREDLRFIPEGEIWVDNSFRNDVLVGILLHEVNEYGRMNKLGEDYETAHENSEKIETDWRNTGYSPIGETNILFKHFAETHSISLPFEVKEINEEYFKQIHGIYESSKLISINYMPVDNEKPNFINISNADFNYLISTKYIKTGKTRGESNQEYLYKIGFAVNHFYAENTNPHPLYEGYDFIKASEYMDDNPNMSEGSYFEPMNEMSIFLRGVWINKTVSRLKQIANLLIMKITLIKIKM